MNSTKKFCSECGASLDNKARYCGACGNPVVDKMDVSHDSSQHNGPFDHKDEQNDEKYTHSPSHQEKITQKDNAADQQTPENNRTRPVMWMLVLIIGLLTVLFIGAVFLAEETEPGYVMGLAFSADDKKLASVATDGQLQLWDFDSGAKRRIKTTIGYGANALSWSRDGSLLALSIPGYIQIYSVSTLQLLVTMPVGSKNISALCFDTDGKTLYSTTHGFGLTVWEVENGARLGGIPELANNKIINVQFSGDCQRMIALESENGKKSITVYERINMETIGHFSFTDMLSGPEHIALNFNGSLAIAVNSSTFLAWDINNNRVSQSRVKSFFPTALNWAAVKNEFAVGGDDGVINIYDSKGNQLRRIQHGTALGIALLPFKLFE